MPYYIYIWQVHCLQNIQLKNIKLVLDVEEKHQYKWDAHYIYIAEKQRITHNTPHRMTIASVFLLDRHCDSEVFLFCMRAILSLALSQSAQCSERKHAQFLLKII
jgi:hypothetical protein